MFRPGHLHRSHIADGQRPAFSLNLDYELGKDEQQRSGISFVLHGTVAERTINEAFFLPRDSAFNFAHDVNVLLKKHGMQTHGGPIMLFHDEYDQMFEHIRALLQAESGEAVDLREFE